MPDFSTKIAEVSAPAKINLCLIVGPRRADGYHPICSVMEKIRLFDTLRTMPEAEGTGIRLTGSGIPAVENLVMKAALALEREFGGRLDVDIELKKEIPVAAGLAGGSSDAAAILKLLTFAFGLEISPERLQAVALTLGADVPFFLTSGPQLAQGVGEALVSLAKLPEYALVLVKPEAELSTAMVYARYDEMAAAGADNGPDDAAGPGHGGADFEERCRRLREDLAGLSGAGKLASILQNDLELPAAALFKGLFRLKQEIMDTGALGALMSGSGSSVFGIFPDREAAETAAGKLRQSYPRVWATEPFRE
jgi:4-diphosphocytidyl-2-C-methyl-D-erythritol kinase